MDIWSEDKIFMKIKSNTDSTNLQDLARSLTVSPCLEDGKSKRKGTSSSCRVHIMQSAHYQS